MIPADVVLAEDEPTPAGEQPDDRPDSPRRSSGPGAVELDSVDRAIADIAAGRAVVVVDDEDRENEGDLVFAAVKSTPELVGFMIRHSSGVICVPMPGPELDRLKLPPMTVVNEDRKATAYSVSVDARDGISTGISAHDRSHTVRVLADSATEPHELTRPGHVFPLRAVPGGVLRRAGHTEAAVDLARLAGLTPVGVICELVHEDGSMMRAEACRTFADDHGLSMISIADLIAHIGLKESHVERVADATLPTEHGTFRAVGYRDTINGQEHVALVIGEIGDGQRVLVRVHSECLTGDVFGSLRCDCGPQLDAAIAQIAAEGRGVVLYIRGHEGRGIGLLEKLRAYELQDDGADTVDANLLLGLPADSRHYGTGAQILADLGIRTMRLLTNNPAKLAGLDGYGITVIDREPIEIEANEHNISYLRTKAARMGHHLGTMGDETITGDPIAGQTQPERP
ncbi:MAG: bifunctional 3,4-dihydroxy-2-butanone-4-phosphate synthase/GTP cyclohydrolase II [Actinomycetes bacterium]